MNDHWTHVGLSPKRKKYDAELNIAILSNLSYDYHSRFPKIKSIKEWRVPTKVTTVEFPIPKRKQDARG